MHDIDEVLGQKEIITSILKLFYDSNKKSNIAFLYGTSGSGKTHVVQEVAKLWENKDVKNKALYLAGDLLNSDRQFFPFIIGLGRAKGALSSQVKRGISELSKGIPFAGDFVSYLFDLLAFKKTDNENEAIRLLNEHEQEILITLNSYYKESQLLFIADNFQWWDKASINLIKFLFSEDLSNTFPFLKKIRILFVITDDQINFANETVQYLIKEHSALVFRIEKFKKERFKLVYELLGGKAIMTDSLENLLYTMTGGHLELIKKLVLLTNQYEIANEDIFIDKKPTDENILKQDFIEKLLILRLQALGAEGEDIIKFLEYASIIGMSFSYEEILCLSKEKKTRIKEIILKAKEKSLINGDETQNSFNHEIIRSFFECRIGNRKSEYYQSFAECLKILRPSEYYHRANLLFEAGQIKEAVTLYIVGYFKNLRDGVNVPIELETKILEFGKEFTLSIYFKCMKEAYALFLKGEYFPAKEKMLAIEDIYPEILLAEKYYLLSLCLSKNLNKDDLIESKNCLLNWDNLKNTESELWSRIIITLLSRYAHLNDYELASSFERVIMRFLSERMHFDPSAEFGINVLRRKASILHIGEIACERTMESIKYFGHQDLPGVFRNPIQYYMALSNHSGNLIIIGKFNEAQVYAESAISLTKSYPNLPFTRLEVPVNNYILSSFFSQNIDIKSSLELFDALLQNIDNADKSILLRNNYAILMALSGDLKRAEELFNILSKILSTATRKDNYYEYYVEVNRSVIYFLLGKKDEAIKIIDALKSAIPSIPDKVFLHRRHELIEEIFHKNTTITDPILWNEYIFSQYPEELGPAWDFFGKGFLFTDVQFWSES